MFDRIAQEQGWSDATQVLILLAYIENQQSDEAFDDFVAERAYNENTEVAFQHMVQNSD